MRRSKPTWFDLAHGERARRACTILAVAKRIEALLVGSRFREMTREVLPVVTRLEQDPGNRQAWVTADDLTGSFERFVAAMPDIQPDHIGLAGCDRLAA